MISTNQRQSTQKCCLILEPDKTVAYTVIFIIRELKEETNVATTKKKTRTNHLSIRDYMTDALERYFDALDGEKPVDLYRLVISEVEEPLLNVVLAHTQGVETKASKLLGISRGTLRKYRKKYGHYDKKSSTGVK